ncbi:MAG: YidC/Oxa1 family membrane protein insertase [Defluviitaleaceae bacterium]|nr:YidC/Oxa1 family membrane protein insertase [Defluviitaleaceae bacterium]
MFDLTFAIAARQVEGQPGMIVGPIAQVFGFLIDLLFNLVYSIGPAHSLGITIILMTIIFRGLMFPLHLKQQKSMMKMRELQPELAKIKEKYGNSKDPEIMRKSQAEQSALIAKHGANPLTGCLPMLIQMPLFFGLNFIMRQTFLYINRLSDMYYNLSAALIRVPGLIHSPPMQALSDELIPSSINENNIAAGQMLAERGLWYERTAEQLSAVIAEVGDVLFLGVPEHLSRLISRFNMEDWNSIYAYIPDAYLPEIQAMVNDLMQIETFLGFRVVESGGWNWPGIIIPILIAVTMFASSWIMQLRNYDPNANDQAKMMQKIMLFVMPVMMAVFTVNFPIGVAIFWITGSTFQLVTDLIMLKRSGTKFRLPFMKESEGK